MATQTEKRRFFSKYGAKDCITDAQYVTEELCSHIASQDRTSLCSQFWQLPKWKKVFQVQVIYAARLLRFYSVEAILLAIHDARCKWIKSLTNKKLITVTKEYQQKLNDKDSLPLTTTEAISENLAKPRKKAIKKNALTKLRQLNKSRE